MKLITKPLLPGTGIGTLRTSGLVLRHVDVTLGMPSKDCAGFGICKLEWLSVSDYAHLKRNQETKPGGAYGTGKWKDNRTLLLRLDRWSMTEATYQQHLSRSHFRMCEALLTPEPKPRVLLPGFYPLRKRASEVVVTIRFRELNGVMD